MIRSSRSRRQLPTQRSATPFCHGARMPVRGGSRPVAFRKPLTSPSNVESWSSSMKRCGPSPGNTSRSCCTTQAGVGSRVTLTCRIVRRRWSMMKKQESSWKVNVGTVKKSQATMASRWLARKADQRLAGSPRRGTRRRYRATLRSETSKPSFKRSPWILGRPPVRVLRCQATDQGPNLLADPRPAPALSGTPAPVEAKAGSMPPDHGLRSHDEQHVRPSPPQMPEGGPEEAVEASQRRPRPLAFEHGDLLSEREDLQGGIAATADEHGDGCQD